VYLSKCSGLGVIFLFFNFILFLFQYKKPNEVLLMEKTVFEELLKLPARPGLDAPGNCNPS